MKKFVKYLFILLICLILVTGCSNTSSNDKNKVISEDSENIIIEKISVEDVKDIIDNYSDYPDVDIIDVREENEYDDGHIEGAINIPLSHIEEINISTERELIVYCRSGVRSEEAAHILVKMGYKVKDMGGLNDWNYDLEK